jgi:mycothiol system anti-sigma-R factor
MKHMCEESLEKIYFYLDGELNWWRRTRVQRHLRRCQPCNGAFEFEAKFIQVIRQKGAEPAPPELIDRLRTFLHEHTDEPTV